jgi:hypothetical protein
MVDLVAEISQSDLSNTVYPHQNMVQYNTIQYFIPIRVPQGAIKTLRLSKYIQGKLNLFVIVVNLMCSRIWLDVRQNEVELSAVNGYIRVVQGFQGNNYINK